MNEVTKCFSSELVRGSVFLFEGVFYHVLGHGLTNVAVHKTSVKLPATLELPEDSIEYLSPIAEVEMIKNYICLGDIVSILGTDDTYILYEIIPGVSNDRYAIVSGRQGKLVVKISHVRLEYKLNGMSREEFENFYLNH